MSNKQTAQDFLKLCALTSPKQAFDKYVNANFKHHNQYFAGDRETLMNAMIESDSEMPNREFSIKQTFEDGDRVACFSHVKKDKMDIAVLHIMRFENGKISEMWDCGQVLDPKSPNKNGMF